MVRTNLWSGLAAGVFGTLVLSSVERLEWVVLGRMPVYAPARIARALARRWFTNLDRRAARRSGLVLRWLYGPCLGVVFTRALSGKELPAAGLTTALSIYGFELIVMPAVGATPRLRAWPTSELVLLLAHTTVFGVSAAWALRALEPRKRSQPLDGRTAAL